MCDMLVFAYISFDIFLEADYFFFLSLSSLFIVLNIACRLFWYLAFSSLTYGCIIQHAIGISNRLNLTH